MKLTKLLLTSTTALGLSMTVALADGNVAVLDQQDAGNSALVTQSGNNNQAGSAGDAMVQRGGTAAAGFNSLTILQSSDNNQIGLTNGGVDQLANKTSNQNTASLTQSGGGSNVIGGVSQLGLTGPGSGANANTLTVLQDGTSNNLSVVEQEGKGNDRNTATVTMSGTGDNIDLVKQRVSNNGSGDNKLTITMGGTGNGIGDFTSGGAADLSGATAANFVQALATRTFANVIITGSGNLVGTQQSGKTNTVGTLDVSGTNNQLGAVQNGDLNVIAVAAVTGNDNNIGVQQLGTTNLASVTNAGDRNAFFVGQNGVSNDANVMITGNDNGQANAFSGAAGSLGLASGIFSQAGDDNVVSFDLLGDFNAFAVSQNGNSNGATATVTGNSNQMAVLQSGNNNSAFATQTGNGNNAGISQ